MCENVSFLAPLRIILLLINIAKIVVPILLIVKCTFDMTKAVTNGSSLKESFDLVVKRLISAVCIFLVPTIVEVAMSIISNTTGYESCIANANTETINTKALTKINELINVNTASSLTEALKYTQYLSDVTQRSKYKDDINEKLGNISILPNNPEPNSSSSSPAEVPSSSSQTSTNTDNISKKYNSSLVDSNSSDINTTYLPYYSQFDSRWSSLSTNSSKGKTISSSGCGWMGYAMIAAGLGSQNGKSYRVKNIISEISKINNNSDGGAIMDATILSSTLSTKYSLSVRLLFSGNSLSQDDKKDKLVNALKNNYKVLLNVPGHYIVLSGIDDLGRIEVLDPANNGNSRFYDSIQPIHDKFKNYGGSTGGFSEAFIFQGGK